MSLEESAPELRQQQLVEVADHELHEEDGGEHRPQLVDARGRVVALAVCSTQGLFRCV